MFMKSNNIVRQHFSEITVTSHKYLSVIERNASFLDLRFQREGRMPCSILKGLPSPYISKRASISVLVGGIGPQ
jgi:hypothetical protein